MTNPTPSDFQPWVLGGIRPQKGSFHTPGSSLKLLPIPFHPGQSLGIRRSPALPPPCPAEFGAARPGHFISTPGAFCGIFWWKIPLKENPTRAALCPKAFPWDAGNARSCHSLSWTTSTFALGLKTATESEPGPFPRERENPSDFLQPIQILSDSLLIQQTTRELPGTGRPKQNSLWENHGSLGNLCTPSSLSADTMSLRKIPGISHFQ